MTPPRPLVIPILALPRTAKRIVALSADLALCVLTVWLAYCLRLGEWVTLSDNALLAVGAAIGIALPIFIVSGLYRAIFRYSGWPALLAVARAVGVYGLLYAALFSAIGVPDVPRTVGIIQPLLLLIFVGASRALARVWLGDQYRSILKRAARPKALIYGAGRSGRQLASAMANSNEMRVVGFLDDDDRLHGHVLDGLPIGDPGDLPDLVSTLNISQVLLAMPSIGRLRRNEILEQIRSARVAVRTLPAATDHAQAQVSVSDLRELEIDDLLGREPAAANHILLARNTTNKVVLVTGAGGSMGGELCRQIVGLAPHKLLLIEQNESALFAIHQELQKKLASRETGLIPLLASVQDAERMREIMSTWKPDTVYHAAAYGHPLLLEHNPAEGISNNVMGTLKAARAAAENGVSDFILVSTDQAHCPANIMGVSKRLAEMVLQALAATNPGVRYCSVRVGKVRGASDTLLSKFRQQIRDGGPITLSHAEITRHFMTIPEAAQLVIQAGAMAKGGDVFVLDPGKTYRVIDLARRMIELSGLSVRDEANPDADIAIAFAGLCTGEKLREELLLGYKPKPTVHPRITKAHEDFVAWADLEAKLDALALVLSINDVGVIRLMLKQLVPGYTPGSEIMDWVHLEQEAEAAALGLAN